MKFKFKIQQFQTDAVENTVAIFNGQPSYSTAMKSRRDLGKQQSIIRHEDGDAGFRNLDVEALKVPMFYVWSRLYGHTHTLSPRGSSAYWLASFKTSPPEYLSECMRLLREGEIPYVDIELRNSLINFYSELAEAYSI